MATKEELEKALAEAEAQIERLKATVKQVGDEKFDYFESFTNACAVIAQIAKMFGMPGQESDDKVLLARLSDVAEQLKRPAIQGDERNTLERQAGTNDPRLIKDWIEAHKAK